MSVKSLITFVKQGLDPGKQKIISKFFLFTKLPFICNQISNIADEVLSANLHTNVITGPTTGSMVLMLYGLQQAE